LTFNPGTHSDHRETGLIVDKLQSQDSGQNITYYLDYTTYTMPVNLSDDEILKEAGLFAAFNIGKINQGCPTDWNLPSMRWCLRNYISRKVPGNEFKETAYIPGYFVEVLSQRDNSNAVLINVPAEDQLSCRIFDISGRLISILVNGQQLAAGKYTFTIGRLPEGIYLLKISAQSGFNQDVKLMFN
jgi:hypothetical protein